MQNTIANLNDSHWYIQAMEQLVGTVQDLSQARDLETIMHIVRTAARELTGADGATFVLREDNKCFYADENAISPLWKGQRFPLSACISGWVMLNATPAVIPDIYKDPRIPVNAYRPTFVKSLVMVPIRRDKPIGAIGNYWAHVRNPDAREISILQSLADVTSVAMENVDLYRQLQGKISALERSNHELECFSWISSHDLKSPLRDIYSLSEWIEDDLNAIITAESKAHFKKLRQRVTRMNKLLDDLLTYAQMGAVAVADDRVSGTNLLNEALNLVDIPQKFKVVITGDFSSVHVPRIPVLQIFCNLIENAVKHHDRPLGRIEIGVKDTELHYIFSVKDDGPGISAEYRSDIFEMFKTLSPRDSVEGSGMGLAIVKKALQDHGKIWVEEAQQRGSAFLFTWAKPLDGLTTVEVNLDAKE